VVNLILAMASIFGILKYSLKISKNEKIKFNYRSRFHITYNQFKKRAIQTKEKVDESSFFKCNVIFCP
jgi:hypothetical protein